MTIPRIAISVHKVSDTMILKTNEVRHGVIVKKGHALQVLRSLYGLKQATRNWNHTYCDYLVKIGFEQSLVNHAYSSIKLGKFDY